MGEPHEDALEHLLDGSVIANEGCRHLEALGRDVAKEDLMLLGIHSTK